MEAPETTQPETSSRGLSPRWITIVTVGTVALCIVALLAYALIAKPVATAPPQIGGEVPDFAFTTLDGGSMDLSANRGEVVVVNFFASWCAPCRQEAAALEETWRDYQGQGVQFYGIAYQDADSSAKAFLDEFNVSYPSTVDTTNRTARDYGVTGVPETFVIDREGKLVQHFLGPITKAQLAQEIELALKP